jgi:2,4-dienoyl-CoA reductase-like NADH-dependent reductase (Old Yellow Enzyme family)
MCQYSAVDGDAGGWHMIHLGHLALSGAGVQFAEATAVLPLAAARTKGPFRQHEPRAALMPKCRSLG